MGVGRRISAAKFDVIALGFSGSRLMMRFAIRVSCISFMVLTCDRLTGQELPSADEIVMRSSQAMLPPVRYTVWLKPFETTVSVKKLNDGTIASRVEAVRGSRTIMLTLGEACYDLIPEAKLVIDKTLLKGPRIPAQYLRGNEFGFCFTHRESDNGIVASRNATVAFGERGKTLKVETSFTSNVLSSPGLLPLFGKGIVAKENLIVDGTSYKPISIESFSPRGELIREYRYLSIDRELELSDDLFVLPDDFRVERPSSMRAYIDLHDTIRSDSSEPGAAVIELPVLVDEPIVVPRLVFNESLGHPVPEGLSPDAFHELVQFKKAEALATAAVTPNRGTRKLFYLTIIAISAMCIFLVLRRRAV